MKKGFGWRHWLAAIRTLARGGPPARSARSHSSRLSYRPLFDSLEDRLTPAPLTVQFGFVHESLLETAGNFTIPVSLSAVSATPVTVPFSVGGSAVLGTDYGNLVASPLVIPAGQLAVDITGSLIAANDGNQTLTFTLGSPGNATLGGNTTNTLTIADPVATPTTVAIGNASAIEPAANGTVNAVFTVTRTGDLTSQLTVGYQTLAGTAQPNTDFAPTVGNVTFPSGAATANFAIPIFQNGVYDNPNLTFSVQLTGVVNVVGPAATFAAQKTFGTGVVPFSIASGDFNGDGLPDLVVVNRNDNTLRILENTSTPGAVPTFATATTIPLGANTATAIGTDAQPEFVAVGDLNHDNIPDIVVANRFSNTLSVIMIATAPPGNATIIFTNQLFHVGNSPRSLALADLNGDGENDIVTTNYNDNTVSVLLNTTPVGSFPANFAPQHTFAVGNGPVSVALGDLNGDAKPDLVVADRTAGNVTVMLNSTVAGVLSFQPPQTFAIGNLANSVALGDFNGDGKLDIAALNKGDTDVSVLLNTTPTGNLTTTSFTAQQTFATGPAPTDLIVGDVNGDGKADLLVTNSGNATASVLLNQTVPGSSNASFAAQTFVAVGNAPTSLVLINANGNGLLALATTNSGNNSVSVVTNSTALGSATLQPALPVAASPTVTSGNVAVAVGDLNGDGKPDIAITNESAGTVSVLLNTTAPGATLAATFATQQTFAVGNAPRGVAIGDLNGDGKPDIVVTNYGAADVSVLLNITTPGNMTATFAAQKTFPVGLGPVGVALGDLNFDGKPDIAVADFKSGNAIVGTASLLFNTMATAAPVASFSSGGTLPTEAGPIAVAVADLDGDGLNDVVVVNYGCTTVSVILANATVSIPGTVPFEGPKVFATGFEPTAVAVGDINGDGQPDLVVANSDDNTFSVLRNTIALPPGNVATFAAQVTFASGSAPTSLALGDVNGDGKLDVILADRGDGNISVRLNTTAAGATTPTFGPLQTFATGAGPGNAAVAVGNLSGDGRADLLFAGNGTSAVLLNNPAIILGDLGTGTIIEDQFATISATFGAPSIPLNGNTTLNFTVNNPNLTTALTGVYFSDTLPSGLVVSTPNGLTGNAGGGNVSAVAGSSFIGLSNGTIAPGGNLTFSVSVTGVAAGNVTNTTSGVDSDNGGLGNATSANLTVVAPPIIAANFGAVSIPLNGNTTLTFTLTNPAANGVAETGVAFTDTLPAGVAVANGSFGAGNGTLVTTAPGTISFSNGTIGVGGNTSFSVTVTGVLAGNFTDTTGNVSSTNGSVGNTASANIIVVAPSDISAAFGNASIPLYGNTTLTFTLDNPAANTLAEANVSFTDTLPAGLTVANGSFSAGNGTVTTTAPNQITFANGSIGVGGNFSFSVTVEGVLAGNQTDTTSGVTSDDGGTGNGASATVIVVAPPVLAASFGNASIPLYGNTTLTFTLTNPAANTVPEANVSFTDTLPAGLTVANGSFGAGNGTVTVTAPDQITFSNGTLGVGGTFSFGVTVEGVLAGNLTDTTGNVTSDNGGLGNTASASINVVAPPDLGIAFGAATIPLHGNTTLTFTLTNPAANALPEANVSFTDTLPAGLTVANGNFSVGNGTLVTTSPHGISFANGTIGVGGNVSFSVTVTGVAAGNFTDSTGNVSSSNGGLGNATSANLTVVAPPTFTAAFGAATIPLNGNTTLTFTVFNPPANTVAETGVAFTDTLPAGLTVANGSFGVGNGTLTTTAPGTISFANGSIGVGGNISFSVTVTGTIAGNQVDTTGNVSSANGGNGPVATANVTVVAPPTIAESFSTSPIPINGTTTLSFTIGNPNAVTTLTGIGLVDTLPAGLQVATPNNLSGNTAGGTVDAAAGASTITLSNATLGAGGTFTFSVDVYATAVGNYTDTTGNVTSSNGGTGGTSSANLSVAPYTVQFDAANETLAETAGNFALTVSLSSVSNNTTTIPYTISGNAIAGTDYTNLAAGTLVIDPGDLTANVTGTLFDDGIYGGPVTKTLTVTLGTPTNAVVSGNGVNTLSIAEIGPRPSFPGLTAQESYIQALYTDEMGRAGSTQELDGWVSLLNSAGPAAVVAGIKGSLEAHDHLVQGWYQLFLGRPAGNGEEVGWAKQLQGRTEESVLSQLLGVPEFYDRAQTLVATGTADQRFVQALYELLLNRTAGAGELAGWIKSLPPLGRQGVALGLLQSQEFRTDLFTEYYQDLMHRAPKPGEVNGWVASGWDASRVRAAFETSSEYMTVVVPPTIVEAFGTNAIPLNGQTTLSFTIANPNAAIALTGISLADTLPNGLVVATPNSLSGSSSGGTIVATAGGNTITLSNATLAAGQQFTFGVNVSGAAAGNYTDTTGNVTSLSGGVGSSASANLTVVANAATISETAGNFHFTVNLSAVSNTTTTIPYTLAGSAAAGTDYTNLTAGTLVIPAGQTAGNITGTVVDDGIYGGPFTKALTVILGTPSNGETATMAVNTLLITEIAPRPSYPTLTAQERYIQALYLDELGRAGSKAELDPWVSVLNKSGAAVVVADIKGSAEATDYLVKGWYQIFFGRPASGGEEQGWATQLQQGQTEESVLSQILGTSEFYNHAQSLVTTGTSDQNFVQALYQLLLSRTAGDAELAGWVNALPTLGQQGVALDILQSQEFRTGLFTEYYQDLLHRAPNPGDVNGWVKSGSDATRVRAAFETSREYMNNG